MFRALIALLLLLVDSRVDGIVSIHLLVVREGLLLLLRVIHLTSVPRELALLLLVCFPVIHSIPVQDFSDGGELVLHRHRSIELVLAQNIKHLIV